MSNKLAMVKNKSRRNNGQITLAAFSTYLLAASGAPSLAQTVDPSVKETVQINLPFPTFIAEGTSVVLAFKKTLKSGSAKKGEAVQFEVASDALSPDRRTVLIPKGTSAFGVVEHSRGAGAFGRAGSLRVRCEYLQLANGTRIPLRPAGNSAKVLDANGRNRSGAALGTGLVVGAVSGLAFGAAAAPASLGSEPRRGSRSISGAATAGFVSTALLASALTRGGNATLREGKSFEAATAAEAPLPRTSADLPKTSAEPAPSKTP
jgi:hypothetical protein